MRNHRCLYCGEAISETAETHSRHLDLCASCSSLADGMGELSVSESPDVVEELDFAVAEEVGVGDAA